MVHHEKDDRDPTEDPADQAEIQPVIDKEPDEDDFDDDWPEDEEDLDDEDLDDLDGDDS